MLIGIVKVILVFWIASTVYRWYQRMAADRKRSGAGFDSPAQPGTGPVHTGRIEDAEFEEMDSGPDCNR